MEVFLNALSSARSSNPSGSLDISSRSFLSFSSLYSVVFSLFFFLFSLLHQILPTKERVARTKPNASSTCKAQGCQENTEENLYHALILCQANDGVGHKLLECIRSVHPGLQAEAALRLEWKVDEDVELPVVWLTACTLRTIWNLRQSNTKVRKYLVRSQLEAEINLLRETRFIEAVERIEELAVNLFI